MLALTVLGYLLYFARSMSLPMVVYVLLAIILTGTLLPNRFVVKIASSGINMTRQVFASESKNPSAKAPALEQSPAAARKAAREQKAREKQTRLEAVSLIKKGGHVGLYALLALTVSLWLLWGKKKADLHTMSFAALCLLLFACLTEFLQYYSATRTPHLLDLCCNFSGIALGYLPPWFLGPSPTG